MEALSARINSLPVSATLAMAAKARELKNKGIDVIGLSLGEPDFNTPEFAKDAAIQAVNENYNSYTPVDDADLKQAIITKFKRDNGLDYAANQIVVSTGAKHQLLMFVWYYSTQETSFISCTYWVSYLLLQHLQRRNQPLYPRVLTMISIHTRTIKLPYPPKLNLLCSTHLITRVEPFIQKKNTVPGKSA